MSRLLTIGEVAEAAGVRTSALRFYEDAGLLPPTARVGGQRRYDESAVGRLTVIRFCQQLGFSLREIRALLTPPRGKRQKQRWRDLVDHKLQELDGVVARVETMRTILELSRDCDCVDLEECAARCATG